MVNEAFAPQAAEVEQARRIVAAFAAVGGGVFSLDGHMVDAPVLRLAQRTLAQGGPSPVAPTDHGSLRGPDCPACTIHAVVSVVGVLGEMSDNDQ